MQPSKRDYARNVAATLVARYGSKALEALVYMAAIRKVGPERLGLVFIAHSASALVYRFLDFGLMPVMVRSSARRELDRRTYAWLLRRRALGVVLFAAGFFVYSLVTRSPDVLLVSGFFAVNGLPIIHELPRAVLAGHERFDVLARLNLASKALESLVAAGGLWIGLGLPIWIAARFVAHLAFVVVAARLAEPELVETLDSAASPVQPALGVVKRGIVFWLIRLVDSASGRLGVFFVTAHAGVVGAAQLGIGGKIHMAALALLGTATQVAFPRLARDRSRELSPGRLGQLLVAASGLGVLVYLAAPFAVRIVYGTWDAVTIDVVRTIAPVLALVAINRPLETWLEAKDEERLVLGIAVVSAAVSVGSTILLVRGLGVVGAGWSRVVQAMAETLLTIGVVALVTRRQRAARGT